jgi:hypothetical protein
MRDVLEQIADGLTARLYYLSLFTALAIPDMCGAIDSTDGRASGTNYAAWFDLWVGPRYAGRLTGEECYGFRCSLLHQGQLQSTRGRYSRIVFVEPDVTTVVLHNNVINDALNIDVRIFCEDIIDAASFWLDYVENTPRFIANFQNFVRRYPTGLAPYIEGTPVIS